MADNDILMALESCRKGDCINCPSDINSPDCIKYLMGDALDLINRQQAEIERLKAKCENTQVGYNFAKDESKQWKEEANRYQKLWCETVTYLETAKAEAIKEFAERLKVHCRKMQSSDFSGEFWDRAVLVSDIDTLVKEITEQRKEDEGK